MVVAQATWLTDDACNVPAASGLAVLDIDDRLTARFPRRPVGCAENHPLFREPRRVTSEMPNNVNDFWGEVGASLDAQLFGFEDHMVLEHVRMYLQRHGGWQLFSVSVPKVDIG